MDKSLTYRTVKQPTNPDILDVATAVTMEQQIVLPSVNLIQRYSQGIRKKKRFLKSDWGLKSFLRGIRRSLKRTFLEDKHLRTGFYHWTDERIRVKMKEFTNKYLLFDPTPFECEAVTALVLQFKCRDESFFSNVPYNKIMRYTKVFSTPTTNDAKEFFIDPFVQKIWPFIMSAVTYDDCFRKVPASKKSDISRRVVSLTLYELGVGIPRFWLELYPPEEYDSE